MKKVYLQYWEESERGWGIRPDGCSLHNTLEEHKLYVDKIYYNRINETEIPYEYDRICGETINVRIKDELVSEFENGTLRLSQYEMNNLIKLEELVII